MKYNVHNDSCIKDLSVKNKTRDLIRKQINRLSRFGSNYPKELNLDIYFSKDVHDMYQISALVRLKEDIVIVREQDEKAEDCIYKLFDRLKLTLSRKIHKERKNHLRSKRQKRLITLEENLEELQHLKQEKSRDVFNHLLKLLLSDVARYIRRRLKSAEMTSSVKKGKFKLQELLDELYLIIYENVGDIPVNTTESHIWLFQKVDEYLDQKFKELEFEKENFERIENIVDREFELLEEKYTVDAEDEIVPLEDIDHDIAQPDIYMVNDLFLEDSENNLLNDLTLKFNQEEIHGIIEVELAKLPLKKRTIMDLFLINQMTVEEISDIRNCPLKEVDKIVKEVSKDIKKKLSFLL